MWQGLGGQEKDGVEAAGLPMEGRQAGFDALGQGY